MSHFLTVVLVPAAKNHEQAEAAVTELLAPYSENLEVPEYQKRCWCVGQLADDAAHDAADSVATWDQLRESFNQKYPVSDGKHPFDLPEDEQEARDAAWTALIAPRVAAHEKALLGHPMAEKPDPDCTSCDGRGVYTSTSNPKAQWDWWQIGGRWTGTFDGYDPNKDPANVETCDLCAGTGKRSDMTVKDGCNGCAGTGKRTKWPTDFKEHAGDIAPVTSLLDKDPRGYAIVTPDGEWHQRGRMGWFGTSSGDKPKDEWAAETRALLEKHRDCIAVAVDCHI